MKHRSQRGTALLEFTLVLPFLLCLAGGMIDFGFLIYNKQVLTNASREAARAGIADRRDGSGNSIIPDQTYLQGIVNAYCSGRLITFGASPTITTVYDFNGTQDAGDYHYANYLTVRASYPYSFLMSSAINLMGGNLGPTLNISGRTVMRIERTPSP